MNQQHGKVMLLNNWLILACALRKTWCGRAKTKNYERKGNKTEINSKERKELCTETPKTKWALEQKAACVQSKTNPMGQVILLLQLYLHFWCMDLNRCFGEYFKCIDTRHFKLHKHETCWDLTPHSRQLLWSQRRERWNKNTSFGVRMREGKLELELLLWGISTQSTCCKRLLLSSLLAGFAIEVKQIQVLYLRPL